MKNGFVGAIIDEIIEESFLTKNIVCVNLWIHEYFCCIEKSCVCGLSE